VKNLEIFLELFLINFHLNQVI